MNTSISDNGRYPDVCRKAFEDDETFSFFKKIPAYVEILEHTSYDLGMLYLYSISERYSIDDTIEMCKDASINDQIGGSLVQTFNLNGNQLSITPSTLRYVKVFCDLLDHFDDISSMKVVEIGGGYGGQCLVSDALSGFKSWDIVDIPEANLLQKKYLSRNNIENVKFISMENINDLSNDYDLIISNYSFSECSRDIQDVYVEKILKNSKHGYMTMNFVSSYENVHDYESLKVIIPNIQSLPEEPNSYPTNRVFKW